MKRKVCCWWLGEAQRLTKVSGEEVLTRVIWESKASCNPEDVFRSGTPDIIINFLATEPIQQSIIKALGWMLNEIGEEICDRIGCECLHHSAHLLNVVVAGYRSRGACKRVTGNLSRKVKPTGFMGWSQLGPELINMKPQWGKYNLLMWGLGGKKCQMGPLAVV